MLTKSFRRRLFFTTFIGLLVFAYAVEYTVITSNYFFLFVFILLFSLGFTLLIDYLRKKLNQNILYKIQQYQAVFNFANNGIAMLETNGVITNVNSACQKLFGYSKIEMIGNSIFDLGGQEQKEILRQTLQQTLANEFIQNIELSCSHKQGTKIPVNISMQLLPDKKSIVMVINSLKDKKKLEKLNKKLKKKVKKELKKNTRIQRIAYEQKIQNARLSSIGKLAAGVTHEINTPLTYIKGNLEMMKQDILEEQFPLKESLLNDMKSIDGGITRIENIIQSMREVSSDNPNEKKQPTNIYETIIIALSLGYKRIEQTVNLHINEQPFSANMPKNAIEIFSDIQRQKIEQVWIIIINNALDVLENIPQYDQRKLSIEIYSHNNDAVVKFKDNAGGINQEIFDKLFSAFVSTKSHKGMGLGLNIAKKIVENQNGSIQAYNENNGAVFEIRLPLYKAN